MAIACHFSQPISADVERYDAGVRAIQEMGADAPEGRLFHCAYLDQGELKIFEVWESEAAEQKFGFSALMRALRDVGINLGEPEVFEVHRTFPDSPSG